MALLRSRGEKSAAEREARGAPNDPGAHAGQSTFIDENAELEGVLRCAGPLRIAGRFGGEVHCQGTVLVTESARVRARIEAESVVVSGEVRGDIHARRKITLDRSARVTGDLETPGIVIEEGAVLEGRILIGVAKVDEPSRRAAAQAPGPRAPLPPGT